MFWQGEENGWQGEDDRETSRHYLSDTSEDERPARKDHRTRWMEKHQKGYS